MREHERIIKFLENIFIDNDLVKIRKIDIGKLNQYFFRNEWKFTHSERLRIYVLMLYIATMKKEIRKEENK